MIILTGAAGFIASHLITPLTTDTQEKLVLSDDFTRADKFNNYLHKKVYKQIPRQELIDWLSRQDEPISCCLHLGARTDTTEFNREVFNVLNFQFTKNLWSFCAARNIPFIYASSAATYGKGEFGYSDANEVTAQLKPLNPYAESKHAFDLWALQATQTPQHWYGLKFFNVYGPNEYHKGRMASVVFHAFHQIQQQGHVKLFKSHREDFSHGHQLRDFIYVKDLVKVILYLMNQKPLSGIYNLGSGKARSFLDLTAAVFKSLHQSEKIEFIDIPADIRDSYQYFTEAPMQKLIQSGYTQAFYSLEEGIDDYVRNYLSLNAYA